MTRLQELICTKMNHDIIGNVGAVCNAVELLEEDDLDFLEDIKNILKTSSFVLSSRLKFFRIAFGLDNAVVDNLENIAQNYVDTVSLKNYPIKVNVASYDKANVKILMLLIMIAAEVMIKGGELFVDDNGVAINCAGINADKLSNLKSLSNLELAPSNAHYLYLLETLGKYNKNLNILEQDNIIKVEVI